MPRLWTHFHHILWVTPTPTLTPTPNLHPHLTYTHTYSHTSTNSTEGPVYISCLEKPEQGYCEETLKARWLEAPHIQGGSQGLHRTP